VVEHASNGVVEKFKAIMQKLIGSEILAISGIDWDMGLKNFEFFKFYYRLIFDFKIDF
jgi:hypothetical protein